MSVGMVFVFIAACSLQLSNAANLFPKSDTNFYYPGPIQEIGNRYGTVNDTDPCKDLTFCTVKPQNYPQERYNKMFKGKLTEPLFQPTPIEPAQNSNGTVVDRQGDPELINNCETTHMFDPLYKVRSETGEWRTVVQAAEENFLQMVRIEMCKETDHPCFTSFKSPPSLKATCKQSYNSWEFLVDDDKGGTEKIIVELPVCCSCHYKTKD